MKSWGITDKGIVRRQNQDAYYTYCSEEERYALLVVCDGMGGARAGNVASKLAAEVFVNTVESGYNEGISVEDMEILMRGAIESANKAVYEKSISAPEFCGMGTTMVAALVTEDNAVIINVGDSRAYLVSKGVMTQITKDHSFVEDLIDRGDISREEAQHHPNKNLITRALGTSPAVKSDLFRVDIQNGEVLFLCSDGLSNELEDFEIMFEFRNCKDLEECCNKLLERTLDKGAPDNVTVLLFEK